ncbi:unnamed protein product [Bursaphelenchus okinawaensis]|uniref:O-acyltransferase n=1 Tax=Bursaphelenchus okinawaensis TaxID=465554 RepID=A0A811JVF3_9BILA|nr:unnamed protein product [Bursaphelenchus okinawaensis]CAG9085517.1 unnamed protein product [Bursaphelenchus okinawaensis]
MGALLQSSPQEEVQENAITNRLTGLVNQIDNQKSNQEEKAKRPAVVFKEKVFIPRESLITQHWDGTAGLLFNFFSAWFILCGFGTAAFDLINHQNPLNHFWLIQWNFSQFFLTMFIWSCMYVSTIFFGYNGLKLWTLIPAKSVTFSNQKLFLGLYFGYLISLFYFPLVLLFKYELNCACSFIITCENTRLVMKVHSFMRENLAKLIKYKKEQAEKGLSINEAFSQRDNMQFPTLQQYVFFTFAPTFIYRDQYPRTDSVNWNRVARIFAHCLLSIYVVNLMFINFIRPRFIDVDYKKQSIPELVYHIFPSVIPGGVCLMMLFYGLLHSWQNMFAEALRFADRQFYDNWWNSRNMAEYYRDWNLTVHDWLYAYVYRDLSILTGNSKTGRKVAQMTVFFLSAAFHEYWFGVSLRLFYPIMFNLYFVCGGIFFLISRFISSASIWNLMMWFNLLIGTGMFVSCYASEWYARQQCEPYFSSVVLDTIVPRVWTCGM